MPLVIVMGGGTHLYPFVFGMFRGDAHAGMMGRYLREVLPPKAAVISSVHSAAVAHYTGRQVVRFDLLDPPPLMRIARRCWSAAGIARCS